MKTKTLTEIFAKIGHFGEDIGHNDKNSTHTYLETYDKLFKPFQKGCTFMEIGLAMGESIRLFDEYFENSKIVGVDLSIVFEPLKYKNDVTLIAADGTKPIDQLKDQTFDIILEDASHMTQDQIDTFNLYKNKMKKGGVYIIEDILALDQERHRYLALHHNVEIIDMRSNGRFDNCLVIIRFD